jgi:hypothetical protein
MGEVRVVDVVCVCVCYCFPGRDRVNSPVAGVFSPLSPLLAVYIDRRTN